MATTKKGKKPNNLSDWKVFQIVQATAQHESGHIVAAALLPYSDSPHRVSTEWQGGSSGHVKSEFMSVRMKAPLVRLALKDGKTAPLVRKIEESKVMTDLAGVVAEEILSGKRPSDGGELADLKTALERLAPFYKTKTERLARLKVLERQIMALLRKPRALKALRYCNAVLLDAAAYTFVDPELSEVLLSPIERILEGKRP